MKLCRWKSVAAFALIACAPNSLRAQLKHSPFMTATGAVTSVSGGQFDQARTAAFELTLGTRLRRNDRFSVMIGAFAGSSVGVNHDEVTSCVITCGAGVALPDVGLSDFKYAGILSGIETKFHFLVLSVLTGPELFYSEPQTAYTNSQVGAAPTRYEVSGIVNYGLHSRADASVLFGQHLAFVITGTTRYFPNFRTSTTHMNGLGVGLRVQ